MPKKQGDKKSAPHHLGEDGVIALVRDALGRPGPRVLQGAGDDCAVVAWGAGSVLLFTTDTMVQDVHFKFEWSSPYQVGWKAVAAAVSDIGAMGGRPVAAVSAVGLTGTEKQSTLRELARGMAAAGRALNCDIVGGDTVRSPNALTITISVVGEAARDAVIMRKGAKPGDVILVAGDVGASAAGLAVLRGKSKAELGAAERRVVRAHVAPEPPLAAGRVAAAAGGVTAMMDLSDGLAADLPRLCARSRVGARVRIADLPVSRETRRVCKKLGLDPAALALTGGEDYALLLCVNKDRAVSVAAAISAAAECPVTEIGTIVEESQGLRVIAPDGGENPWPEPEFEHFKPNRL